MFKCEHCKQQIAALIPSILYPLHTRKKNYPKRYSASGSVIDHGGKGYETVREIRVCPACRKKLDPGSNVDPG